MKAIQQIQRNPWIVFHLLLPIIYFGFVLWFMPVAEVWQFDVTDEGIELMKAVLYRAGFDLYREIWNDQPPLFTILLSWWFGWFGQSVLAARLLTLSFSTLLVWAFTQTLRRQWGNLPALWGAGLLVISCNFMRLSVSVMAGLPALALAMVAVYWLILSREGHARTLLIGAGCVLALSLQIKLFTVVLLPLCCFEVVRLSRAQAQSGGQGLVNLGYLLLPLVIVFSAIALLTHSLSYDTLLQVHLGQNVRTAFSGENSWLTVVTFFLQDFDYGLLAIPAGLLIWQRRNWHQAFYGLWLLSAVLLLLNHKPIWYHYYLLISLPLTALAAAGVKIALQIWQQRHWQLGKLSIRQVQKLQGADWIAGLLVMTILLIPVKLTITQLENIRQLRETPHHQVVTQLLQAHRSQSPWLFTEQPMYAFRAGLVVPPEIAVFSTKRVQSGNLGQPQLQRLFQVYQPDQLLLGKFPAVQTALEPQLTQDYQSVELRSHLILYIRQSASEPHQLSLLSTPTQALDPG